jgi:hypothetical protein
VQQRTQQEERRQNGKTQRVIHRLSALSLQKKILPR